jgi:hypothetical protein
VIGVDLKDSREIVDTLLELTQFLKGTATDIEGARVVWVQLHQRVAVLDGLGKAAFFQEARSTDEKRFFVCGVFLKFFCAH